MGPKTQAAQALHSTKHRLSGESYRESCNRIATALTEEPANYRKFRNILLEGRFWPGGRIQITVGSTNCTTPYNCFVSGTIEDSFVDGPGCIMDRLKEAACTLRMGGGIGYDFSTLRPRGDTVRRLNSYATGPVSFMRPFNEIGHVTASTGNRRGAQMGILRIDHPDIEEFVRAKQNSDQLNRFNLSIAVTGEFMDCLSTGRSFKLRFGGRVYREVDPVALWEQIMRGTWDWAEPGVVFIDTINRENNLWYCETIAATNPCSEQPLPPFGACLLGSFNLCAYMSPVSGLRKAGQPAWEFDWDKFQHDIPWVVEAMDRVVDVARYPLPEQEAEAKAKRRMGLGIMGLANAGEAQGLPYGSPQFIAFEQRVLATLRDTAYRTSMEMARRTQPFPAFSFDHYLKGPYTKRLPDGLRREIARYGIRNSHLVSLAPTGTISQCADNVSSGIEPVFSIETDRPVEMPGGTETFRIKDYGAEFLGVTHPRVADEVTAQEHVAVLCAAQEFVDSAVSKTCNVSSSMPWTDFKDLYSAAYQGGAKGLATFQNGGKRMALLKAASEPEVCYMDSNGQRSCS